MKKYAAIDIGTNSMRMLVSQVEGGAIVHRRKEINTTRIGHSVDRGGFISEEGMEKNLEAFARFVEEAREEGVEKIWAIATSAVRDAKNGKDFVRRAYEKTGVLIEMISGEKEGELGYQGVLMGLERGEGQILVVDIGGGSTELIVGNSTAIQQRISANVGALRMTERHITTNPISQQEYERLEEGIHKALEEALSQLKALDRVEKKLHSIVGIGGTTTTLAALHQELDPYDMNKVHGYSLNLAEIIQLQGKLLALTTEERKKLKGIHPRRADIIVAGISILLMIMKELGVGELVVSEYDNLEGLLYEKMET